MIRGRVVEVTTDGAAEHMQKLRLKYTGRSGAVRAAEQRLIFKIEPEREFGQGAD